MKKTLLTIAIMLFAVAAQAHIKVNNDGHISIGSLTQSFGIQLQPNGYVYFRPQHHTAYGWVTNAYSNKDTMLNWMVKNVDTTSTLNNKLVFYVRGDGKVWAKKHYVYGDNNIVVRSESNPIDKEEALSTILQLQGYLYKENSATSSEEIMESEYVKEEAKEAMVRDLEKRDIGLDVSLLAEAFPDAVRTDPEARLCIDNNAIITLLVEAVKQQQEEIEFLRKALMENGLMESEKQ